MMGLRPAGEGTLRASHVSALALFVLFAFVLPISAIQLMPSPAYLPVVASFTIACDALTAALLLVRAVMSGRLASAVLACGYAFVGLMWIETLAAYPDLFVPGQAVGTVQTTAWLLAFRFGGFAAFTIAYVISAHFDDGSPRALRMARTFARGAVPAALVLALAAFAVTIYAPLPTLISGTDIRPFIASGVGPALFVLSFASLALLTFARDQRDPLGRWLWVAAFAGLVELAFTFVVQTRFSVAWYVGRATAFAAALAVLSALCFEVVRLYGALRVSKEESAAQEREAERLAFLTSVAQALSATLDLDALLDGIAHRLRPVLGDRITIFSFDEDRASVGVAAPPEAERDLEATLRGSDPNAVLALLGAEQRSEAHKMRVQDDGSPELIVPLCEAGRITGAIVCARDASRGLFTPEEVRLAEDVASRATFAVSNVRVFERERRLADSLQRGLLPSTLPQLAGLSFDAVHHTGATDADIGGDWYDAFELPSGAVAFSIGDVAGRGLPAAIVMGRVRQAIRAFALVDPDPRRIVENCDRLLRLDGAPMVSTIVGVVDPSTRAIAYANAGHPGPIVVSGGRATTMESPRSLPLGLIEMERVELGTITLPPGGLLVLHTDGLIELERDVERGEAALHAVLEGFDPLDVARPADEIRRRTCTTRPKDDVAVLTISAPPDLRTTLDVQLPATAENSRSLRHSFRRVAREAGIDDERTFAYEVAVGEAIANVMEHAYGAQVGIVRLRAYSNGTELYVEVIDYGRWRAPRKEGRGHGMTLMRELTGGRVDLIRDERSTSVRFSIDLARKPVESEVAG